MKMPYHLEKGPLYCYLEEWLSTTKADLVTALERLRRDDPISELIPAAALTLGGPYTAPQQRVHINEHWQGRVPRTGGGWDPQPLPPASPWPPTFPNGSPRSTGYWVGYAGNVEEILRLTFIRAAEVSLGIAHSRMPTIQPVPATRHWPISIFWKCPQAWFEGWVSWREEGGAGRVVVILCTPAHLDLPGCQPAVVRSSPLSPGPWSPANNYAENPPAPNADTGTWVVTHRNHTDQPPAQFQTGSGMWNVQVGPFWYAEDPTQVVTVQPAEAEGGVRRPPRTYP